MSEKVIDDAHARQVWRAAWRRTAALDDMLRHRHVRAQVAEVVVGEDERGFVLLSEGLADGFEIAVFAYVGCER